MVEGSSKVELFQKSINWPVLLKSLEQILINQLYVLSGHFQARVSH